MSDLTWMRYVPYAIIYRATRMHRFELQPPDETPLKTISMRRRKIKLHKKIRSGQFHRLYQGYKPTCPVKPAAYKYTKTPSPIPNPTLCLMNGIRIIIAQRFNFINGALPALA